MKDIQRQATTKYIFLIFYEIKYDVLFEWFRVLGTLWLLMGGFLQEVDFELVVFCFFVFEPVLIR